MEKIFRLDFKTFIRTPISYIFFLSIVGLLSLGKMLLKEKDTEINRLKDDRQVEILKLEKCNLELERRNKILEEIVFNEKLKKDGN